MDKSEEQFQELFANLAARLGTALSKQDSVPPIGLLLLQGGDVEVVLAISENEGDLIDEVNLLQQALIDKAREKSAAAACLAYPDYPNEQFIAYLENTEHYCAKCSIPVVGGAPLRLDIEGMKIEDGMTFVFGEGGP